MDDLLGQDWSASANSNTSQPKPYSNPISLYPGLQPSPAPSTGSLVSPQPPQSRPLSTSNTGRSSSKLHTPANDSFATLLGRNTVKGAGNLTIEERQRQLLEEKRKQEVEQRERYAKQFGGGDVWDSLGTGTSTPAARTGSPAVGNGNGTLGASKAERPVQESEDDILAAFNSAAPVDKSSHFPPPASSTATSGRATPASAHPYGQSAGNALLGHEDDDPFGLGSLPQKQSTRSQADPTLDDDDDILGDLAKPVTARPPQRKTMDDAFDLHEEAPQSPAPPSTNTMDRAVAELVDMGFPPDTSRVALQETDGTVQAAVSFLLNQAHQEANQKMQGAKGSRRGTPVQNGHVDARASSQRRSREEEGAVPAWMRQDSRPSSAQRRHDTSSPGPEKDVGQYASEIGSTFLKSANSLWKQGRKQVQKAVVDFQAGHDPNQPKWMRDVEADQERSSSQRRQAPVEARERPQAAQAPDLTDEAILLETGETRPQKSSRSTPRPDVPQASRGQPYQEALPVRSSSQPRSMQQAPHIDKRPTTKLSRQEVDAQTEQAYVSPARRKRPAKPEPQPEPEIDLFSSAPIPATTSRARSSQPQPAKASPATRTATPSQPIRPRPSAPTREIPTLSSSALSSFNTHRHAGTEAFKRGDYDSAHTSYTAALNPLPSTHPFVIIVLSNRALTALKTGDPKLAVSDADKALALIGASRGEGEKIDLGAAGGGEKDMREFYGKALMRKAEALEHMEKWTEAANVWRLAIEAGVGGAVSLRGRDRCEKAANPAAKPSLSSAAASVASAAPKSMAAKAAPKPAGRSVAPSRPALSAAQSAEAVRKLREANLAAEKADDEKFALTDQVDAKLTAWKGGKADNLRALLGSLDNVLWAEAGWKKVGMSELVLPNKVKIVYMKAIAKVHPDKVGLLPFIIFFFFFLRFGTSQAMCADFIDIRYLKRQQRNNV